MDYRTSEAKDAARAQFRGLWAAITTPFTRDLEIDEAGLRRNMRYLTETLHVDGIFCTGVMGEFWALTKEERKRAVAIVAEEARGRCRVIAHTGHHSALETVELTQHAEAVGADFAILMTPYYPAATEDMIHDWFTFIATRVNIGIWLFDTPFSGCAAISPSMTARLARIENICGAKIARSLDHYLEVKRLAGDQLVLSTPSETDFLAMMRDHGQRVHQSSATPYLLQHASWQPVREYTELGLNGRFEQAAKISAELKPLRDVQHHWIMGRYHRTGIVPIATIKAWSEFLGMTGGPVRTPLLQLGEQERSAMRNDLERIGLLSGARAAAVA